MLPQSRVKHTSVIWLLSLVMSGLVYAAAYLPELKRPAQALGVLLYASFIIAIISYYVGNIHYKQTPTRRTDACNIKA